MRVYDARRRVAWRFVRAVIRSQASGVAGAAGERADRVVVMEHGRVVEVTSHDELVEQGDRYAPVGVVAGRPRRERL